MKLLHLGPAAFDFQQIRFHLVRQTPALRIVQSNLDGGDAGRLQQVDLPLQEEEALALRKLSHEVRSPGGANADSRLADAPLFGIVHRLWPALHHLLDRTVDVSALVNVADVNKQREHIRFNRQGRGILFGQLSGLLVVDVRQVGHARFRMKLLQHLLKTRHLGYEARADKGTDGDALQAGLRKRVQQLNFCGKGNADIFDAEALTHDFFVVNDRGPTHG